MLNKFKDLEFEMPKESEKDKKKRLDKMADNLLSMINKLKEEYEKENSDKTVKKQLKTAIDSLEKLKGKMNKDVH